MREIKFRGRSIDGWLYGETIWFNEFPTLNDRQIYMPNPNDENCDELNIETWSIVFDVCQFTGLKDMNGKEIYEGDIVRSKYFDTILGESEAVGVVEFKDGVYLINNYYLHMGVCEVLGNIYENSELIDNSK